MVRQMTLLLVLCWLSLPSFAQPAAENQQPLRVGVLVTEPFVTQKGDSFDGLSIRLWQDIADRLGVEYKLEPAPLGALIEGVEQNKYDLAIGAITITADRETRMDFSQPFHNAGLAIAVPSSNTPTWWAVTQRFISLEFFKVILVLGGVLFIAGGLVWWFEKRANPDEFSEKPLHGLGSGFWWAAVTMTTVGYGDKSPKSFGGRAVSLVWMFTCVIVISSFTASIASSLTVSQFQSKVTNVADLANARVATIDASATAAWLDKQNIGYQNFSSLREALKKLDNGKLDAVVYDEPILRYLLRSEQLSNVQLLPERVLPQDYGFALPQSSSLREPLNRELLSVTQSPQWRDLLQRYLGQ
ncbi:transporter substrate-binding domain-containing protein [Idiomarina sp. HP20-50]|uniref:transporter substrate-binding domain-containing protein n=1 Tax=Idiomarina sp. HP20-50 TaxID=3070813 RepID=UPI00294B8837|nr:transporter substrate-binding domain-containing protein [Idiomarina sp. HP20-50]MDV6316568.1 transporter substrate-binding domain-containing protein [Idiomarina sp. HP20-50]